MLEVRIGRGVHGNGLDAQLLARPKNPQGDFPTIRNQDLIQH